MDKIDNKTLRTLDDVCCTNVITSRNIRRLIRKHDNLSKVSIDCWVHGWHYVTFELSEGRFKWLPEYDRFHTHAVIYDNDEDLESTELNKLIVETYRSMCDLLNDDTSFIDTPEELLAVAEERLKQLLADNK